MKTCQSSDLLVLQWQDKKKVTVISTVHDDSMVVKRRRTKFAAGGTEEVSKPAAIQEYNTYMGGVDKGDQLFCYYPLPHRTVKWWKRAFFHLLEVALVNTYIMYTQSNCSSKRLNHQQFRQALALQILEVAGVSQTEQQRPPSGHNVDSIPKPLRLVQRHFPELLPPCDSGCKRQCVCIVCSKKKKGRGKVTTIYHCKQCNLAMCVTPCFELYHSKVNPTRYLSQI